MKHLKSFTILEALISLIVMGVIIALTYSFITLIGKQLYIFEKENTQVLEYNLYNTTILNDINKSIDYSFQDNTLELMYYDGTKILYEINHTSILRQNRRYIKDTFSIKNVGHLLSRISKDDNLKMALQIKMILLGDTIQTNYFLKKDTAQFINQKIFYEN